LDLGNSLSVGGGIGSFQKGNLRTQSQGLHYFTLSEWQRKRLLVRERI
jgi:hypothetical protein